jgi:2,4-dienoyl-CoA reductase-like NADH-dependent reductase (Old Yellow Enzyme family)
MYFQAILAQVNEEYMIAANGDRVVIPPMASGTADSHGAVTSNTIDHYRKISG